MSTKDFDTGFEALTGNPPFPWQQALFERFCCDDRAARFPATCDIPTGLGKTSVVAIWLLALAHHARNGAVKSFPRRLVYVVNRRTVVDQSTREATQLRQALRDNAELLEIADVLRGLASKPSESALAISTLRGEFADNAEWRDDPARPAVIVGTVDMIGSRLLFSGYGRGFKSRPLHAGFLGQDAILVHDEAHLEPAFQTLVESIHGEQQRNEWERGRFHVMALSATARSDGDGFTLTKRDLENQTVKERVHAKKAVAFHEIGDDKKVAENIATIALSDALTNSGKAILIFVRQVKDVTALESALQKANHQVETLTGTLRGYERDALAKSNPIFARFMPKRDRSEDVIPREGTVYLVCTSAGEVGVNISADHLVCDLSPFDSMAQRFGRVNRFGSDPEHVARIEIVVPTTEPKGGDAFGAACQRTYALLQKLPKRDDGDGLDASPDALRKLPVKERLDAFTPKPNTLPATDILFDAWAMTTIRDALPGRPPVDDYLHGVSEYEPPETHVAWRDEVERITGDVLETHRPDELLEDFPLKAHELLRDRTDRVREHLQEIAVRCPEAAVWIVERDGSTRQSTLAAEVTHFDKKRVEAALSGRTVLLPPHAGGLSNGLLRGDKPFSAAERYDVADQWFDENNGRRRARADQLNVPNGMRLVREIDLSRAPEQVEGDDDQDAERIWYWYAQPWSADDDGSKSARQSELLTDHLGKARDYAQQIASKLVDESEAVAIARAAEWHDLGKDRRVWQLSIGNLTSKILAKSGPGMRMRQITKYRHEFGSLIDIERKSEIAILRQEQRELLCHLIAAHHGRARPHFARAEAFDPERPTAKAAAVAREVPLRFAQLQQKYGRWGLAYLESLVRAADALASQDIGVHEVTKEAAE